jgi:hypothetical protein
MPTRVVSAKVNLRHRLAEIWQCRELIIFLVRKELKVRYKNSVLGFLWSFLNPALILAVYYVVFKYFLANHMVDFAIYLFAGLLPWNLFNNSLLSSAGVLVAQAGIVKKVSFPREILAIAQVGTAMCYFFFQACIMLCFLLGFGVMPDWKFLPVMLFALVCDIVFSGALSIFLSAVNVYLRDRGGARGAVLQCPDCLRVLDRCHQAVDPRHLVALLVQSAGVDRAGVPEVHLRNCGVTRRSHSNRELLRALVFFGSRDRLCHLCRSLRARDADFRQGRG